MRMYNNNHRHANDQFQAQQAVAASSATVSETILQMAKDLKTAMLLLDVCTAECKLFDTASAMYFVACFGQMPVNAAIYHTCTHHPRR